MQPAVTLALNLGLRRGEVCGLRWCDVDFNKDEIRIFHTVKQNGSTVYEKEHTKTKIKQQGYSTAARNGKILTGIADTAKGKRPADR